MTTRDSIIAQESAFYFFIKTFILDRDSWQALMVLSKHDNVYVLSGVIRDFLTGDYDGARDFDIVLLRGNYRDPAILHFLRKSEMRKNSFGGIKIRHYDEVVDVWRMSDTWGLRKQQLELTPESLINTVFFNFSAIVYDFNNRKFIFDDRFCNFIQTQTMDVVYPENPNIPLCLVNICHYQKRYGYNVSERMVRWIKGHYSDEYDFETVQQRHFGTILYPKEIIKKNIHRIINKKLYV